MQDIIREYARIIRGLKDARKQRLEELGHTEESLRELEDNASANMELGKPFETEYGIVQKVYDKDLDFRPIPKKLEAKKPQWKHKLILLNQEKS